ncbi:carbohydrate ABC transporter permease [Rubrivirga sp.]|uniref:carbohydrate ABC transporter permease n=1 Tax=Rubrivirga sp. TaxID=1885344 RepID=UPI003B520529
MTEVLTHQEHHAAADLVRARVTETAPRPTPPPVRPGRRWGQGPLALAFLSPTLLVFGVFVLFPVLFSFYLSFTEWNLFGGQAGFIGVDNYTRLFADPEFWQVFVNTAVYTVATVPLNMALALATAFFLHQKIVGTPFLRAAFFSPVVISAVAAAVVWRWVFDPNLGLANAALEGLGLPAVNWINDPTAAMGALILVGVWKSFGVNMVLFAAGLASIPTHYYEAARIDGANGWERFFHITLPLLAPTTLFVLVFSMIGSFQVFDLVFVLTNGGPLGATKVLVVYLYEHAFKFFDMGYASAVAYVLFAVLFALTLVQIRAFKGRGFNPA